MSFILESVNGFNSSKIVENSDVKLAFPVINSSQIARSFTIAARRKFVPVRSPIQTRSRSQKQLIIEPSLMADQIEDAGNPKPTLEQRMEKMEGNYEQILSLLREITLNKGSNPNGNSSHNSIPVVENDDANDGGEDHVVQPDEKDSPKVVIITPKGDQGGGSNHEKIREEDAMMLSKMEMLEEKVRAMQGIEAYGRMDMRDFCLFPDMEIPSKFKVPDFEKFEGKTDPMVHLTMYTRSMAAHHKNEKLMVHCFQHSLSGGALTWFLQLDKGQMKSWRSLAELFVKQYQFVTDIAPDRFELQRMKKADRETFREYAQRWREKASQVQPPLNEKEIVRLFVKTLDGAYFEKLLGCVTNRFSDVVIAGEQIEDAIREGKLSGSIDKFKKPIFPKKEGEVHMIHTGSHSPKNKPHQPTYQPSPYSMSPFHPYPYLPYPSNSPTQFPPGPSQSEPHTPFHVNNMSFANIPTNNPSDASPSQPGRDRMKIDPVPTTYSNIYDALLKQNLVAPEVPKPTPNPIPKWYNANETCKYHMGAPGHSIERCISFKIRVQRLRDIGKLSFEDEKEQPLGPNIGTNPLPTHGA